MKGSPQQLDSAGGRQPSDEGTKLAVIVKNQVARSLVKRRRLSQLLGNPLIGGMARYPHVNNFPGAQCKEKEGEQRPKPEIGDLKDVAGPYLMRMVVEEGGPSLARSLGRSSVAHTLLDRAFTHLDAQLE